MFASAQPQAAFVYFTKSIQFQWNCVQRVIGDCQRLFGDLETVIWEKFLPILMGNDVSSAEHILFFSSS